MATMTTAMAAPIRAQIASPWTTPQATAVMSWAPVSSVSRSVRQGRGRIRVVRVTAQALDCLALFDSVHAVAADPVVSTCGALHGEGP